MRTEGYEEFVSMFGFGLEKKPVVIHQVKVDFSSGMIEFAPIPIADFVEYATGKGDLQAMPPKDYRVLDMTFGSVGRDLLACIQS